MFTTDDAQEMFEGYQDKGNLPTHTIDFIESVSEYFLANGTLTQPQLDRLEEIWEQFW